MLADDGTHGGFDRNPVWRERSAPVWLAEQADGRGFLMKRDRHVNGHKPEERRKVDSFFEADMKGNFSEKI